MAHAKRTLHEKVIHDKVQSNLRSSCFCTFPVDVFGSSVKITLFGDINPGNLLRAQTKISLAETDPASGRSYIYIYMNV
jgi:hypothetical protein